MAEKKLPNPESPYFPSDGDYICPDCDVAGHTVSLDFFATCELCGENYLEEIAEYRAERGLI